MTQAETEKVSAESPAGDHGRFYWFCFNSRKRFRAYCEQHRTLIRLGAVALLCACFFFRSYIHVLVMLVRRNSYIAVVGIPLFLLLLWWVRASRGKRRLYAVSTGSVLFVGLFLCGRAAHSYVTLYLRYASLSLHELKELPLTDHERIHPRNTIFSLAHEAMSETESPTVPNFVRVGEEYRWTMAVEPAYPISRAFGGITHLFSISGTSPSPTFSQQNRIEVDFPVGENLLFSHNSRYSAIRSFGLWRFFNYQPADTTFIPDDKGEWVEIVSLIRWKGIFFPRPEFGGVQLMRQQHGNTWDALRRMLFGVGEWIPPEEIGRHKFLLGQNILPLEISRFIANSFRFHNGFFAPLPGYHYGDVRIPHLAADVNVQPFTGYFTLPGGTSGSLYQYFGLEPYDPDKQGLNTSLFIPADGTDKVYVFKHAIAGGAMTGVSAIAAKVMESRKQYDWDRNKPVEHRPYIKRIGDSVHFFWMTTVVTLKESDDPEHNRFISGSIPDIVITDAGYNTPVWVDPRKPEAWVEQINKEMQHIWEKQ